MKYLRLYSTDPYYNLAVEEYLLCHTQEDIFMLWQNDRTVVIGKNQNAYAEVDLAYAEKNGIRVARRLSGGGAVYHDMGNLNYTFITSRDRARVLDYAYFTRPVIRALAALGVTATLSGRNDIECAGKKISGNAQYVWRDRILHHGTLLFSTDKETLSRVLRADEEKLAARAVRSHKGRVGNLAALLPKDLSSSAFVSHIEREVLSEMKAEPICVPTDETLDALRARYSSREWIYSEKRFLTEYSVSRRKKYPFGIVSADLTLFGDRIKDIRISGDFFGIAPIAALEDAIKGKTLDEISHLDPSPYIAGMTGEALAELLQ